MSSDSALNLWNQNLGRVPDSVWQRTGLEPLIRELHLRINRLASLPASVGELSDLRQLDRRGNPLTQLPDAIAGLPRLEKLDLRWVPTLTPPPWIGYLQARGCLVYR